MTKTIKIMTVSFDDRIYDQYLNKIINLLYNRDHVYKIDIWEVEIPQDHLIGELEVKVISRPKAGE